MYRNYGMLCLWQAKCFANRNVLSGGTIVKKSVVTLLLCGAMVLAMAGCGGPGAKDAEKDFQQSQETYGTVERESCDVLVAKFNTEVVDNSALNPASSDYLTEDHDQYWYGLLEGVYLVVVPETYTGDPETDIVDYMLIYADNSGEHGDEAVAYAKHLVTMRQRKRRSPRCSNRQKRRLQAGKRLTTEKASRLAIWRQATLINIRC